VDGHRLHAVRGRRVRVLLKVLLSDDRVRARVFFGSDFYVVRNAKLEERRRSVRIRAVLGEDVWRTIAEDNPREFLGL
jgi:hypothetical protein